MLEKGQWKGGAVGGEATSGNDCVYQECAQTVPVELAKEQGEQAGTERCSGERGSAQPVL